MWTNLISECVNKYLVVRDRVTLYSLLIRNLFLIFDLYTVFIVALIKFLRLLRAKESGLSTVYMTSRGQSALVSPHSSVKVDHRNCREVVNIYCE